jgi:hypothetical protein
MTQQHAHASSAKVLASLAFAFLIALALMVTGCSANSSGAKKSDPKADRKAMMETVAKFYVAQGAQDLKGIKSAIHDPDNIMELPTETPPATDAETTTIKWQWNGDKITLQSESEEATYTLSSSEASPNVVKLTDATGETLGELVMTQKNGAWLIDVAAVKKAAEDAANSPEGQKETCWGNQQNIEDSAAAYNEEKGKMPKTVQALVPDYMDIVPACPTTGVTYSLDAKGLVTPCKVHGHYPASEGL